MKHDTLRIIAVVSFCMNTIPTTFKFPPAFHLWHSRISYSCHGDLHRRFQFDGISFNFGNRGKVGWSEIMASGWLWKPLRVCLRRKLLNGHCQAFGTLSLCRCCRSFRTASSRLRKTVRQNSLLNIFIIELLIADRRFLWMSVLAKETRQDSTESNNIFQTMYENKAVHYVAVIRFHRGSPGTFCTAFEYDTKQTEYGEVTCDRTSRQVVAQAWTASEAAITPYFCNKSLSSSNKYRIQSKQELKTRSTTPPALRVCTNFNSENCSHI